jgi:hypothetical protein
VKRGTVPVAHEITTVVMCHPRRSAVAARLAGRLTGLLGHEVGTVVDPDPDGPPSALRTAARAWAYCDGRASHHAVVQDDVEPAANLGPLLARAVRERPGAVLAFYANSRGWNGAIGRVAALAGHTWATPTLDEYFPTLAVVMPCAVAHGYASLADERLASKESDDDEVLAQYLARTGTPGLLRVPNLVEHRGLPSLSGYDTDPFKARDQYQGIRRSVCFQAAAPAPAVESHLARLPAWPHFSQRRALLRPYGRHTLTRAAQYRVLGVTAAEIHHRADAWFARLGPVPERRAAARRYLRELYLAGYGLGHVVASVAAAEPDRTPAHEAAVGSYLESGLGKLSAEARWRPYWDVLMDTAWDALRAGYRAA